MTQQLDCYPTLLIVSTVGRRHDALLCRPLADVLPADRGRDEVGESIGRAGERGNAQRAKRRRRVVIETRRAFVVQRQQRDHIDAARHERSRTLEHLLVIAAFIQVADQDQGRVMRLADQALAIRQRPMDVGAPRRAARRTAHPLDH